MGLIINLAKVSIPANKAKQCVDYRNKIIYSSSKVPKGSKLVGGNKIVYSPIARALKWKVVDKSKNKIHSSKHIDYKDQHLMSFVIVCPHGLQYQAFTNLDNVEEGKDLEFKIQRNPECPHCKTERENQERAETDDDDESDPGEAAGGMSEPEADEDDESDAGEAAGWISEPEAENPQQAIPQQAIPQQAIPQQVALDIDYSKSMKDHGKMLIDAAENWEVFRDDHMNRLAKLEDEIPKNSLILEKFKRMKKSPMVDGKILDLEKSIKDMKEGREKIIRELEELKRNYKKVNEIMEKLKNDFHL